MLRILPLLLLLFLSSVSGAQNCTFTDKQKALIESARFQVGRTLLYDPSYIRLNFPNGDIPEYRGVCTDVIIRAYRRAFGYDLQKTVHDDMKRYFATYPKNWGMTSTDRNIDHRRVPNLKVFFKKFGQSLPVKSDADQFCPGDLVTQILNGGQPHILIVSDKRSGDNARPLVIHNIGSGAREEDALFDYPITGHYRFFPE